MNNTTFDEFANYYDEWFLNNKIVLFSEARLVAKCLENGGRILSVGCGSGLFEMILKNEFNIEVEDGIEPSASMAQIAVKRGMNVKVGTAEGTDFGDNEYDTVVFNGTPSYITDLDLAVKRAYKALKKGGKIVLIDVPKEGSYSLMYNLAMTLGSWDDKLLDGVRPNMPYPIEFVKSANWRTTAEKTEIVIKNGFENVQFYQTLTKHPLYSDMIEEEPCEGCDRGDYVAVCAIK